MEAEPDEIPQHATSARDGDAPGTEPETPYDVETQWMLRVLHGMAPEDA